jgi:dolichyl-diphosphooligosaccharide--protein glycosyltransferase
VIRTALGRIDTDAFILFFFFLASVCLLFVIQVKRFALQALYAVALGFTLWGLTAWYARPGFIVVYVGVLVLGCVLYRINWKRIICLSVLVLLCAGPSHSLKSIKSVEVFLKRYQLVLNGLPNHLFKGIGVNAAYAAQASEPKKEVVEKVKFKHTYSTISEQSRYSPWRLMQLISRNPFLAGLGFILSVLLFIFHFRLFLPLLPIFALGLLSFVSGKRFLIYLGPFVGLGLAFLLNFLFVVLQKYERKKMASFLGQMSLGRLYLLFFGLLVILLLVAAPLR